MFVATDLVPAKVVHKEKQNGGIDRRGAGKPAHAAEDCDAERGDQACARVANHADRANGDRSKNYRDKIATREQRRELRDPTVRHATKRADQGDSAKRQYRQSSNNKSEQWKIEKIKYAGNSQIQTCQRAKARNQNRQHWSKLLNAFRADGRENIGAAKRGPCQNPQR